MDNTTTPPSENPENLDNGVVTDPALTPTPAPVEPAQPVENAAPAAETPAPAVQPVVADHGSKKGFLKGVLFVLLLLLLTALAAGAVYMWQQNKVDDLNAQLQSAKIASTNNTTATTATKSTDPDLTKATTVVKDFYTAYSKDGANSDALITKYGTANLAFYNKYYNYGFNPIICAQDTTGTYTYSGSKSEDGVATVLVKDAALGNITVRVVDQGGLKVDGVTCPGALGTQEPHPTGN